MKGDNAAMHSGIAKPASHSSAVLTTVDAAPRMLAPSLRRRLGAWVYEGVLLFGLLMISGLVFSAVVGLREPATQTHARWGLQAFAFVLLGVYFCWCWSRGGQTVAQKAWRLRVVDARSGRPPSFARAALRYLLAWMWFFPALVALPALPVRTGGIVSAALLGGVAAYAALTRLREDRQFWHDAVAGTRVIDAPWQRDLPTTAPSASP